MLTVRKVGVIVVAVLVLGVTTTSASATVLLGIRANGAALANGSPFLASSSDLTIRFGTAKAPLSLTCETSTLSGTLTANRKVKDVAAVPNTTFDGGDPNREHACASSDDFIVTAGFGPVYMTTKGIAELRLPQFDFEPPPPHTSQFGDCHFHSTTLKGKFPVSSSEPGEPLVMTFTNQRMNVEVSGHECGTAAFLSATFTVSSEGFPAFALLES
jgi:hypothetical protein